MSNVSVSFTETIIKDFETKSLINLEVNNKLILSLVNLEEQINNIIFQPGFKAFNEDFALLPQNRFIG